MRFASKCVSVLTIFGFVVIFLCHLPLFNIKDSVSSKGKTKEKYFCLVRPTFIYKAKLMSVLETSLLHSDHQQSLVCDTPDMDTHNSVMFEVYVLTRAAVEPPLKGGVKEEEELIDNIFLEINETCLFIEILLLLY